MGIQVSDCDISFQQGRLLVDHLEKMHNLKFETETLEFLNMNGKFNYLFDQFFTIPSRLLVVVDYLS